MCFEGKLFDQKIISISAISNAKTNVAVDITAKWIDHYTVDINQASILEISPRSSQSLLFNLKDGGGENEELILVVESLDNVNKCIYVTINDQSCPLRDTLSNVQTSKLWSRMISKGYFPINKSQFGDSIIVSFVPLPDSSECFTHKEMFIDEEKPKTLNVTLLRTSQDYSTPIGISVSVILFSCVLFFIMWSVAWQCLQHSNKEMILRLEELNLTPNNNSHVSLSGDKSFNVEPPASSTPLLTIENTPMTPINIVRRNLCIKIEETEKRKSKFIVNRLLVDKMFVSETCQVLSWSF